MFETIKKYEDLERLVTLSNINGYYHLLVIFKNGSSYSRSYIKLNYALNMFSTYVGYPEAVIKERKYY